MDASYESFKKVIGDDGETINIKIITQLINCSGTGECTSINKDSTQPLVAGYYFDASTYNDNKYSGLIKCEEEKDNQENITGYSCSQVAESDMKIGFYLDSSTYNASSKTVSQLIYCDDSGCTSFNKESSQPLVAGYYLDSSTYKTTNLIDYFGGLIKCSEEKDGQGMITNYSCLKVTDTEIKKGYYLNSSTYKKPAQSTTDKTNYFDELINCVEEKDENGDTTGHTCHAFTVENENSIYINQDTDKLIQCSTNEKGCSAFDSTGSDVPAYYINAAADTTTANDYSDDIIKCVKDNDKVQCKEFSDADKVGENFVFLNANLKGVDNGATGDAKIENINGSTEQLIICSANKCNAIASTVTEENAEYYLNSGIYTDTNSQTYSLLKCYYDSTVDTTSTKCISINLESADKNKTYLNGNWKSDADNSGKRTDTTNKLIRCSNATTCSLISGSVSNDDDSIYYVNAGTISTTEKLTDALIVCTKDSCLKKEGLSSIIDGVKVSEVYFVNGDYSTEKDSNGNYIRDEINYLIKCTVNGCEVYKPEFSDAGEYYYIHGGNNGFEKAVIKITLTTSNASRKRMKERKVISTTMDHIETETSINTEMETRVNTETETSFTYEMETSTNAEVETSMNTEVETSINTEVETSINTEIETSINTEIDTSINTEIDTSINTEVETNIYTKIKNNINTEMETSINNEVETDIDDEMKEINFEDKIFINKYKEMDVDREVNSSSLEDMIFIVNMEEDNDEVFIASGSLEVAFDFLNAEANDIYLVASGSKQLIQCQTVNEKSECLLISAQGSNEVIAYYLNADAETDVTSENGGNSLIQCGKDDKCIYQGVTDKTVYINSNYYDASKNPNGDKVNQLIICYKNDNNIFMCSVEASTLTTSDSVEYYSNADTIGTTKSPLITCMKGSSEDANVICSSGSVTLVENVKKVYLNGNFKKNTNGRFDKENHLLVCDNNACTQTPYTSTTTAEYYVNAGANSLTKLIDTLIKCDSSGCDTENMSTRITNDITEVFFINKSYNTNDSENYLIKCDSADGCAGYKNTVTDAGTYLYVHGIQNDFTDAIIACTLGGGKADCIFLSSVAETNIYINSFNKNIIQCYKESNVGHCASKDGSGTANVPIYYKNAAISEASDLNGLLIKCTGEKTCDVHQGVNDGVYINSNFQSESNTNGDPTYPLIICNTTNKTCKLTSVESNSYYVNSGVTPTTSYNDLLISCSKEENVISCITANGDEDNIYLNGNYKKKADSNSVYTDETNQLIICNETNENKKCELQSGKATSGNDYYVNSGAYNEDHLVDTLIECSNADDGCITKSLKDIVKENIKEVFFINKNYGSTTDNENYLIKCDSTSGCTGYKNDDTTDGNYYYVHGIQTGFSDAIIKCSITTGSVNCAFPTDVPVKTNIYINSFDKNIIQCYGESNSARCVSVDGSGTINVPSYYRNADITAADSELKDFLIQCTGIKSCDTVNGIEDGVYLNNNFYSESNTNGDTTNQLIICDKKNQKCDLQQATANAYYINSGVSTTASYDHLLILCTSSTSICDDVNGGEDYIYLNGYPGSEDNKLIICNDTDGKKECKGQSGKASSGNDYYVNDGSYNTDRLVDSLIECSSSDCLTKDLSNIIKDNVKEVFFINKNYDASKDPVNYLIHCSLETTPKGCKPYGTQNPNLEDVEHYIYGLPDTQDKLTNAMIEVTFKNVSPSGKRTTTIVAEAKLKTGVKTNIFINSFNNELIQCISDCKAISNTGTDTQPKYYVNAALTDNTGYKNLLIKCTSTDQCELMDGHEFEVYINNNFNVDSISDDESQLIICSKDSNDSDKEKCKLTKVTSLLTSPTNHAIYYKNSGEFKDNDNNTHAMIECKNDNSSNIICETKQVELGTGSPKDVFFINANYNVDNKYLIRCTTVESCVIYSKTESELVEDSIDYYVHGGQNAFEDSIIQCTVDANKAVTCIFVDVPEAGYVYINSSGNNLIQCFDTEETNGRCDAFNGVVGSSTDPAYYVNGKGENTSSNYEGLLIKCSGMGTCENDDGGDNKVFINSNYKDTTIITDNPNNNGDDKRLIICSSNKCQTMDSLVSTESNYYLNSGVVNPVSSSYVHLLIQCREEGACILTNGATDNVYLNGNYKSTSDSISTDVDMPLIICFNSKCELKDTHLSDDGSFEYYVNAGKYTDEAKQETYPLIICTKNNSDSIPIVCKHEVAKLGKGTPSDVFYKNANYNNDNKYLIQCTSESSCSIYSNNGAIKDQTEYYVHGGQTKYEDAIITCKINDVSSSRIVDANCGFETGVTLDNIYINSSNGNLIQCTTLRGTNGGCDSFSGVVGSASKPAYFINGNGESTAATYSGLLIKCKGLGLCEIFDGTKNGIYINSNYKNVTMTTDNPNPNGNTVNRLISCNNSGNGKCEGKNYTVTSGYAYYMNTGAVVTKSSTYSDLLVRCPPSGPCTIESGSKNNIYLNGNQAVDSHHLIYCNNQECTLLEGISKNGDEYYVNAGASSETKLSDTLIKCSTSDCTLDTTIATKITSDVTELFYINKNFSPNNDPDNYVIKCSSTDGCVPYGETKLKKGTVKHYVHGAQTKIDDAIIKVSFPSTSTELKIELLSTATTDNIFINSYTKKLIQCKNDGCSAYSSTGAKGRPVYYVNSENQTSDTFENLLIKCEETCEEVSGKANDVYLNGNFVSTENTNGDTSNHLIICANSRCALTANAVETGKFEYYVNAGAFNSKPLVDTLIECSKSSEVSCTTKDVSSILNDTTMVDTFFLNNNYDGEIDKNYLIQCKLEGSCQSYSSGKEEDSHEYYVNGGRTTPLDDTLIQCEIKNKKATCTTDKTKTLVADNQIYLNSAHSNQIIRCLTNTGCMAVTSEPTEKVSEYYMNGDDATGKSLIKCSKKDGCQVTSKEITTTANNVFINANAKAFLDTTNPLIKCTQGVCALGISQADTNKPEYYQNSDQTLTDPLKNDLILCTKEEEEKITCKPTNAKSNDVYLNADYDETTNKKPLIICTSDNGCQESITNSTDTNFIYYINAGHTYTTLLTDTLIECGEECATTPANNNDIYINGLEMENGELIHCTDKKGCVSRKSNASVQKKEIYLNASYFKRNPEVIHANNLIICTQEENNTIQCQLLNAETNGIYINAASSGEIIQCLEGKDCAIISFQMNANESPVFYVNGDPMTSALDNNLIKCRNTKSKVVCEILSGKDGEVYLNGNSDDNSAIDPLIVCTEKNGCITTTPDMKESSSPQYYVNSGNFLSSKLNDTLIQCAYESNLTSCSLHPANVNEVYINYGENKNTLPLIKCQRNGCVASISNANENNNEYYINSSDNENDLPNTLIECSMTSEDEIIICNEKKETKASIYMNANYAENGDKNQLIQCDKEKGCLGLRVASNTRNPYYYLNAESSTLNNAIIYCVNKNCEKQTPSSTPMYFVDSSEEVNGLIECIEESTNNSHCSLKSAFTSSGYYLNSGINKATNQTIICSSEEGCQTMKVNLGYYVNAGDESKPIIKCDKNNAECSAENVSCPISDEAALAGDYCYSNGLLKFYVQNNSTAIFSKSDDYYVYGTIPSDKFPGITRNTGSLFKISRYFINQFFQSGVVMIDKNGKLIDSPDLNQSDTSLYDCNEDTKLCTLRPACIPFTYMFDSENKKALYCNEYKHLETAEFTGYVVDGTRTIGTSHPYLIKCDIGKKCVTGRSKVSSYYVNSGYDSATNKLIQCNNHHCTTVAAEVGFYVGHEGAGIINCSSQTSCFFINGKLDTKYLNAGFNKVSHALIECSKKKGCSTVKAKSGNYLTYTSSLLIDCRNPNSCFEFTPIPDHYDNADASGGKNSMINCEENGSSVICKAEAGNEGFYISKTTNTLIRCKSGSKCRSEEIKNGYFRGAFKAIMADALKSNKNNIKRSDEEYFETSKFYKNKIMNNDLKNISEKDDVLVNDTEKNVTLTRRDSEEIYGIIRCNNGKCEALSSQELSAIPICEFNNNKCYITLEYSMTSSATTSVSAGNICTNSDRSIFYFATDTIVVKPNVIAGVTSTYVYTTTNSNCLEVNDSYQDMYFTVGPNIYRLDDGSVVQFYKSGFYFINTAKNTIVTSNSIEDYNDKNVKLYHCNGITCYIVDKPKSNTYIIDVNKRILIFNINEDAYSFAYDKDIICIFSNNKCTPKADLNEREFCVTYKGEICLAKTDIKNRETGECYKSTDKNNSIYGYSKNLYLMNLNQAQLVDKTGYYLVSHSTNSTIQTNNKNFKLKNNNIIIYSCENANCKEYQPKDSTYYYDERAKTMIKYKDGQWHTPSNSGYALVSLDPTTTYIYKFTKDQDTIKIEKAVSHGYHYTIDGEMFSCNKENEEEECQLIEDTGYYFTNAGEVYYCVYDSEGLEVTECIRQACINGQYYYINESYYRCESDYLLLPVMFKHCSAQEKVIMNFPVALTKEYPPKVKQAMESIKMNNNSTAIITHRTKNYLASVSGIFTNCTYDAEEVKSTFDMICLNNYVTVDKKTNDLKVCSIDQLGYVECINDDDNPEKCNVSGSLSIYLCPSIISLIIISIIISYFTDRIYLY